VLGENIPAAMLIAKNATSTPRSFALSLAVVADGGTSLKIDPSQYAPLDQELVVCGKGAKADAARTFADFIARARVATDVALRLPASRRPPRSP